MIGNLFLKFKTCPFINCTFNLNNSKSHECCVTIGLEDEYQLEKELDERAQDLVVKSKCIDIKENEYVYDIEYTFEEIEVYDEDNDTDTDVEYDFREFITENL